MKSKLFKKLFSMLLVAAMVLSMCPTMVLAAGEAGEVTCPCPECNGNVPSSG